MAYQKQFVAEQMKKLEEEYKCPVCPYCNGERDATVKYPENKPEPWKWWNENLGAPKHTVAPMVNQSELPFRMLTRKYGATLAYTPMFHAKSFAESAEYRRLQFSTCPEDRPLFVQFCGHDADTVLAAARHVENDCDAVDLNLGCPQGIARRGHYGSFLMEHWDTIHCIVHTLHVELKVPVTVKIRKFDDLPLTLKYARMLRAAGAHLIAVHGRLRIQKGADTGMADLPTIRAVREHITDVPMIANGNILTYKDVEPNLEETGCQSAMSAEALLWDPRVFANPERPIYTGRGYHMDKLTRLDALHTTIEYLSFVKQYPVDMGMVKAHLFKMLYHSLEVHLEFRNELGGFDCGGALDAANDAAEKQTRADCAGEEEEATCNVAIAVPDDALNGKKTGVSSPTSSTATTSTLRSAEDKRADEIALIHGKCDLLLEFTNRLLEAEKNCSLEGSLYRKSAAEKAAERKAKDDAFSPEDFVNPFDSEFMA